MQRKIPEEDYSSRGGRGEAVRPANRQKAPSLPAVCSTALEHFRPTPFSFLFTVHLDNEGEKAGPEQCTAGTLIQHMESCLNGIDRRISPPGVVKTKPCSENLATPNKDLPGFCTKIHNLPKGVLIRHTNFSPLLSVSYRM